MSDMSVDSTSGEIVIVIDGVERGRYATAEVMAMHFGWLMQEHDKLLAVLDSRHITTRVAEPFEIESEVGDENG